ncbi:MAG TPA: hypothetical protein VFQ61_18535 [Polyangiaceae bacterium]|nr:hypothetical protein [Polyangiaceae bacterium]
MSWDAPAGCPTGEVVQERIRELLGSAAAKATHLQAQGKIVRAKGRYRLTLTTLQDGGGASERTIESSSCSDLAGAAAVTLGLWIRFELAAEQRASESAQPRESEGAQAGASGERAAPNDSAAAATADKPASESRATPEPQTPDVSKENAERSHADDSVSDASKLHLLVHAPLIGVEAGPLPGLRPSAGLALGFRLRRWRALLGARATLGETIWASGNPRRGAELQRLTAELRGCYGFGEDRFEFSPCLFLAVERVAAKGVGGDEIVTSSGRTFLLAPGLGVLGNLHLTSSLGLFVSLGAQIETSRPRLVVEGLGQIRQLAQLGLAAHMGLEWIL